MNQSAYLDNNATTVVAPEVWEAMQVCKEIPLNPSSIHRYGQKARALLEEARACVAGILEVLPQDLVFTSSATESINTLIKGARASEIITTKAEHSCIHETALALAKQGTKLTSIPLLSSGALCLASLETALEKAEKSVLIVLGSVNAETGVLLPVEQVARLCKERGAPLLIDAVAQAGRKQLIVHPGVSALCLSGHKFHGPKGVGCFYAHPSFPYSPLLLGGQQEGRKRAGTENVEGALGLATALSLATRFLLENETKMRSLRDSFEKSLAACGVPFYINGSAPRICNVSNLAFGVDGEALLISLDAEYKIAASRGSACGSGSITPSRVLQEMGLSRERISSSIRFSFGRYNTLQEVDYASRCIAKACKRLKDVGF
ncbi:MAG: cysteine desulfurase family protein [Chlamydiota bacterium]